MNVLQYLSEVASATEMTLLQRQQIEKSYTHLASGLRDWFGAEVLEIIRFGSSTRGTMLPIRIDEDADIDCMVVFANTAFQQQTYLNQLLRFIDSRYPRSILYQDHPTAVVELDHIKFELVPATKTWLGTYRIPAKWMGMNQWADTNPTQANAAFDQLEQNGGFQARALVRLLKYWNLSSSEGKVFPSYELEKKVTEQNQTLGLLLYPNLADRFFSAIKGLQLHWSAAEWKRKRLDRTRLLIEMARLSEKSGRPDEAVEILSKLFR